jgi:hypothetical protein
MRFTAIKSPRKQVFMMRPTRLIFRDAELTPNA